MNRDQILRLAIILGSFAIGFWLPLQMLGVRCPFAVEVFFDLLVSLISGFHIFLHFRESSNEPKSIKSWLKVTLILDIICLIPFSLLFSIAFLPQPIWILPLNLTIVRHTRIMRRFLDGFPSLQPITYRLVPLIVFLPLLVHLVACGWIGLSDEASLATNANPWLVYVRAVYWSFTTLTTVGYGDITASNIPQMLYCCAIQVAGVGVFGFILSNVAGLLARSDAAREHHMDNLDRIETFMRMHRTPLDLRLKIRNYYHYMWTQKKGYKDDTLLEGLPPKIQSELYMHVNRPMIEKVPFLRGADPELLGDLMSELVPRIFVPGEKIFRVDDPGDELYFIQSGDVEILQGDGSLIAVLGEGTCFGEMALISDRPRRATARAVTFCDTYSLSREAFIKVTTAYPSFLRHLEEVMRQRQAS